MPQQSKRRGATTSETPSGRKEWPRFNPDRRKRIREELRGMLQVQQRDPAQADAIVAELEWAVKFFGPQPTDGGTPAVPEDRDWPFPAEVGQSAHALMLALQRAGQLPLRDRPAHPKKLPQDLWLTCRDPEAFIEGLERLATPPQPRHAPKLRENRTGLECAVLWALKHAGLPWRAEDAGLPWRPHPGPARVLSEVMAYAFPRRRAEPSSADAERAALGRAVKRCGERLESEQKDIL